ncbi:MAG: biotin/lipoate A/B protein ligase family protein [Bacillota bacterium]
MRWRLLVDGAARGSWNMAVDHAILEACSKAAAEATIRFYRWDPPCLSIGYFQSLRREVDTEYCKSAGIEWVRRPTGGRAVLHDDEITYSVVAPESALRGTVLESYKTISEALLDGFARLGVQASIVSVREKGVLYGESGACFDAPSWYEITVGTRKLVGSAQVRKDGAILQHGSILLSFDAERLLDALGVRPGTRRDRLREILGKNVGSLNELADSGLSCEAVTDAMIFGFRKRFATDLEYGALSDAEIERARELERSVYRNPEWNERK